MIPIISLSSTPSDNHSGPYIVNVLPLPVYPYANILTLSPSRAAYTNDLTSSKIYPWVVLVANTLSKWNMMPSFHLFPTRILSIASESIPLVTYTQELS